MVHFSRAGIDELSNDPRSAALMAIVRSALPNSNWFIMNVLNIPPRKKMEEMGEEEHEKYGYGNQTVGLHTDTNRFCKNDVCASFSARAVQVLYISIPSGMNGGELVFHTDSGDFPDHEVTPQNNMLVKFDGRMPHFVKSFSSPSNEHRISLVLESYVLPPSWLETEPDLEFL